MRPSLWLVALTVFLGLALEASARSPFDMADKVGQGVTDRNEGKPPPQDDANTETPQQRRDRLAEEAKRVREEQQKQLDERRQAQAGLSSAIKALAKEYDDAKDGKLPRDTSNYLSENANSSIAAASIIDALNRRQDSKAAKDAYIKWQLMSGLNELDDRQRSALARIYRSARSPKSMPLAKPTEQSAFSRKLRTLKKDNVAKANEQLEALRAKVQDSNRPILLYRNELFGKLAVSDANIQLGLKDAYSRAKLGIDSEDVLGKVDNMLSEWSAQAKKSQLRSMYSTVNRYASVQQPKSVVLSISSGSKASIKPVETDFGKTVKAMAERLKIAGNDGGAIRSK